MITKECPGCGGWTPRDTIRCTACGYVWHRPELDPNRPNPEEPLQAHIDWYMELAPYRVAFQSETSAQLVRPKVFSFGWALFWFLFFGVGVLVYILYYLGKKDAAVYLVVAADGTVKTTFRPD